MRQESLGNHSKGSLLQDRVILKHFTKRSACETWHKCFKDSDKHTGRSDSTEVESIKCQSNNATLRNSGRELGR